MADYTEITSDDVTFSDLLTITEIFYLAEPEESAAANETVVVSKDIKESAVANEEVLLSAARVINQEESAVANEEVAEYRNPSVEESAAAREFVDYFGEFIRFPTDISLGKEEITIAKISGKAPGEYAEAQEELELELFEGQILTWRQCSRYNESNTGASWEECDPFDI